jgi:DtxR family transcriptional regulator, Mn-dependent transcriptional regulator
VDELLIHVKPDYDAKVPCSTFRKLSTMVNISADRSPERAREDYIKVIYQLGERKPARAAEVARRLGVSRASVSKFKRMLERENLLEHSRGRTDALRLTRKGMQLAVRMVRTHRLVETFLHKKLGVPLHRVHSEAERIEHAISDDVSIRLDRFLSHPIVDPHGHKIPASARSKSATEIPLSSVPLGGEITVSSIDDRDPAAVQELSVQHVLPGSHLVVVGIREDGLRVRMRGRELGLSRRALASIRCSPRKRYGSAA